MVLFLPAQQALDCISDNGRILGQIRFDITKNEYAFFPENSALILTGEEQSRITEKLVSLVSGQSSIPMQDDD